MFHRTKKQVEHSAPSTIIIFSREDPSLITSEAVLNFCTPDLKPVGPASKTIQFMTGSSYEKSIQQSLNKNGRVPLGHLRKLKTAATVSAWVHNFNAPKYKMNIKQTPSLQNQYLTQVLPQLKSDGIERVTILPNDLASLGYPLPKLCKLHHKLSGIIVRNTTSTSRKFSYLYKPKPMWKTPCLPNGAKAPP